MTRGRTSRFSGMPNAQFAHGVASGDPRPSAVVIWTRVTPTAASTPGLGRGPEVTVRWQVAREQQVPPRRASGQRHAPARPATTPSRSTSPACSPTRPVLLPVPLRRLRSRVGRTRTAPRRTTRDRPTCGFGVVSCANLQAGWFSAYRHLADRDDLHAVLHLGDYLYEYAPGEYGYGQGNQDIRPHEPAHEMVTLADYRQRHAQYKRDPDLQRLHAKYPFIVTWDDHEVTNDPWRSGAENHNPRRGRLRRRAGPRAHRAYDEWMPVRMDGTAPLGDGTRLFRRLRFGRLAELSMLDLRTYRGQQVARCQVPDPGARSATPTARSPATRRWTGSRSSLPGEPRAVEAGRQPGDDRAGQLRRHPARPDRPDQRRHRAAAPRTGCRTTSTSGTATPPTAARSSTTSATTGSPTRSSSPATSTPAGPATCRTTPRPTRAARELGGRRVRVHVGDHQQPQGHHRRLRRARPASRSRRRSRPTTGTSSTSTSTTTASRSSTSPRSGRRWTGSSSATGPTGPPA